MKKAKKKASSAEHKIIDDVRRIAIGKLRPNEWNPNEMDAETRESLRLGLQQEGFVTPILVQLSTSRIIDGEHRWTIAGELGFEEVLAQFVDCDDDTAKKLTLAFNNRRGVHRADKLGDLLTSLKASAGELNPLELGYSKDMLDRILANNTSFLDDFAERGKGHDGDTLDAATTDLDSDSDTELPAGASVEFAKLQYLVRPEHKRAIIAAVGAAKEELQCQHAGEALAHICARYTQEGA